MLGFVFTGSAPLVHPFGGVDRVLGTNPLAISIPTADKDPIVVDMATSALSASRIRQASYFGEEVPDGTGVDSDGNPTRVPLAIRPGGAISPLAEHKGFALGLVVALLAGPLVGAQTGLALQGWLTEAQGPQATWGHFMMAVDPSCFGEASVFKREVARYLEEIRGSRKAPGVEAIRIPGERSFETRRRSLEEGVVLFRVVWDRAATLAQELGVGVPPLDS
jgi:LDH2 family malate/lactate/ureidoglycolate dehydrogenase